MTIKRQPPKASEAQIKRIREFAAVNGKMVEDYVCVASKYRTTSLDRLYKHEAAALIASLTTNTEKPC